MSPTQGRILVNLPIQYPVFPSASVMMGWLPSAPTHLQRGHVLQVMTTHSSCCSLQIPLPRASRPSPPPATGARRASESCAGALDTAVAQLADPVRHPSVTEWSPPPIAAPTAHSRHSSPSQLAAARLAAQARHPGPNILLSFLSRAQETSCSCPPAQPCSADGSLLHYPPPSPLAAPARRPRDVAA
jgi:hypothetical protein